MSFCRGFPMAGSNWFFMMSCHVAKGAPLSICLLSALWSLAGSARPAQAGVEPDAARAEPRLVSGLICLKSEVASDISRAEVAGVGFTAQPLSQAEWEGRLEREAAGMGSALRPREGGPAPFQVFLLAVQNRSRLELQFQPGNTVRILDQKQEDHIVDYTDLYRFLTAEGKDPESLRLIQDAFFDSALSLAPGEGTERLLLFRPPQSCRKSLVLLLSHFQVGTQTYDATLPFHVEKVRK